MAPARNTNIGRCTAAECKIISAARCDAFYCQECCDKIHSRWPGHIRPDGTTVTTGGGHSALPACYGGADNKVEYDDTVGPEFGKAEELHGEERVFVPMSNWGSNWKAQRDFPIDFVS